MLLPLVSEADGAAGHGYEASISGMRRLGAAPLLDMGINHFASEVGWLVRAPPKSDMVHSLVVALFGLRLMPALALVLEWAMIQAICLQLCFRKQLVFAAVDALRAKCEFFVVIASRDLRVVVSFNPDLLNRRGAIYLR